eukprot:403333772
MTDLSQQDHLDHQEEKKESLKVNQSQSSTGQPQSVKDKLEELGYFIKKDEDDSYGKLRQIADDTKGLEWKGQANYDQIADLLTEHVQQEFQTTYGLQEVWIPEDKDLEEDYHHLPRSNIYMSPEFRDGSQEDSEDRKALILIQGTGAVRAGVWARSVCMNESLKTGSMLYLVEQAQKNNLAVLVMNPNLRVSGPERSAIPFCHSMESHAMYVWDKYVLPSKFKKFHIIAHSAGGACLASIQKNYKDTFYDRTERIALTDSWTIDKSSLDRKQKSWMWENAVHFVASDKPAGAVLRDSERMNVCMEKSAGHNKHEYTTGYAHEELIKHFGYI